MSNFSLSLSVVALMAGAVVPRVFPHAFHAGSAFAIRSNVGVLSGELMPLRAMCFLGVAMSSVPNSVSRIFSRRTPGQVAQTVVSGVAVQVSALHAIGARAYEGFQNEGVNKLGFPAGMKRDTEMAAVFIDGSFADLFGNRSLHVLPPSIGEPHLPLNGFDRSETGNRVGVLAPRHWNPFFSHTVNCTGGDL